MYFPIRYVGIFFLAAEVYCILESAFEVLVPTSQAKVKWEPPKGLRIQDDPIAREMYNTMAAMYDEMRRNRSTSDLDWYSQLPVFKSLDEYARPRLRNDRAYESLEDMAFAQIANPDMRDAYRASKQTAC